ncbi:related to FAD dependent oxidoreductase, partial [Phialocephala subalpina]
SRGFYLRVPLELAYPNVTPSIAETAYFEDTPNEVNLEKGKGKLEHGEDEAIFHAPPEHNVIAEYIQDTAAKTGIYNVARFQYQASGHYHAPKVPAIPGLKQLKEAYPSRIQHSKRYRSARGFQGKAVLLIGGSTSSTDIAKELTGIAKTIYQSTRSGAFDHPISMLPPEAKRTPEVAAFNLEQHPGPTSDDTPILGTVTLVNGKIIIGIDNIIIATVYHCTFPFLSEYHCGSVPPSETNETTLVTDSTQMHNLHKDILYIPDPTLASVGVPYHVTTFPLFEFQAITVGAVFSGKVPVPRVEEARVEYQKRVEKKGFGVNFHSLKGKDMEYVNELLTWINLHIVAGGGIPVEGYTKEWIAQWEQILEKFKELFKVQPATTL